MSMEQNNEKKGGKKLDNIIMGVILGGAIGSVLGLTLAPRKGEDTRKIWKKKGQELVEKGKEMSEEFMQDHQETIETAKYQMKKGGKGFFRWFAGRFGIGKKKAQKSGFKLPDEMNDE